MEEVIYQSAIVFVTQIIFLWARTYNVRANAMLHIRNTLLSGAIIHMVWLISISIGASGVYKVLVDHDWKFVPVIIFSLGGSLIGCYIGLRKSIKARDNELYK